MATHDYVIDDQTTPQFRSDLNNALSAIVSNNNSATEPADTFANMWWVDTANNYLKIRDENDAAWIIVAEMDVTNSRIKHITNSITAATAAGIDIFNSSGTKIIDLQVASQATAEAGTNNTELMTPLRTKQAIATNPSYPSDIIRLDPADTSYTLPAGTSAILIKASGGGGGGARRVYSGNAAYTGSDGVDTTVTCTALSIAITAKHGRRGINSGNGLQPINTTDVGGDFVHRGGGAIGGFSDNDNWDVAAFDGKPANLVVKYVTGDLGGEVLTLSIGAGGAGGSSAEDGQDGYVELWMW